MNKSHRAVHLCAQVRVVLDDPGIGRRRAIRRALLIDRSSGLLHELPTTYIFRQLGQKALNTQVATLYDLAFYIQWCALQRKRNPKWQRPEERVRAGKRPLTEREVSNLGNWCQSMANELVKIYGRESTNLRVLSPEKSADNSTTNRRLNSICNYLCWLMRDMIEGTLELEDRELAKSARYQEALQLAFASETNASKKAAPLRSLDRDASASLRTALTKHQPGSHAAHKERDTLIGRLFLESGLRAGELLKLYCEDIDDNYSVASGKTAAVVKVIRRPNDPNDARVLEPAVKTLPGPVSISRKLAAAITHYIIHIRRPAVERRKGGRETPYLFICHSGKTVGQPMSRRNLNRIITSLGGKASIPEPLAPHKLRHTHFTELMEIGTATGKDPAKLRSLMISRGHWSPKSKMPEYYGQRHIASLDAEYAETRDRALEEK